MLHSSKERAVGNDRVAAAKFREKLAIDRIDKSWQMVEKHHHRNEKKKAIGSYAARVKEFGRLAAVRI